MRNEESDAKEIKLGGPHESSASEAGPPGGVRQAVHELNNAVMVVTAQIELALDGVPAGDPMRRHLEAIARAAGDMQRIARTLADAGVV
jgi:hypothetical protein